LVVGQLGLSPDKACADRDTPEWQTRHCLDVHFQILLVAINTMTALKRFEKRSSQNALVLIPDRDLFI